MKNRKIPPIHPGEILMEEFLGPMGISQYRLAKDISVSPRRINEIVHGKRSITADTALRLGRFLLSLDGTGYYSSKKIFSDNCLEKANKKTGEIT